MARSGTVPKGKRTVSGPQMPTAIDSKIVAAASELMRPEMLESERPRSGRNAIRSSSDADHAREDDRRWGGR